MPAIIMKKVRLKCRILVWKVLNTPGAYLESALSPFPLDSCFKFPLLLSSPYSCLSPNQYPITSADDLTEKETEPIR